MRHYARYRRTTNNKLTFFQKLLVFSVGKRAFKLSPIVSFGVLFRLEQLSLTRTVGTTEYKGHLQ